jgi:hypothetical protein
MGKDMSEELLQDDKFRQKVKKTTVVEFLSLTGIAVGVLNC